MWCGRREAALSRLTRPRRRRSQGRREWQPGWSIAVTSQLSQLPRLTVLDVVPPHVHLLSARLASLENGTSMELPDSARAPPTFRTTVSMLTVL